MSTPSVSRDHRGGAGLLWEWGAVWSLALEALETMQTTALEQRQHLNSS